MRKGAVGILRTLCTKLPGMCVAEMLSSGSKAMGRWVGICQWCAPHCRQDDVLCKIEGRWSLLRRAKGARHAKVHG